VTLLAYGVPLLLVLAALYGASTTRNLVHLVNCLNVGEGSVFLFLVALGYRRGATAPVFSPPPPHPAAVDPVLQAIVVTGVVVGATTSALLLALTLQAYRRRGSVDPADLVDADERG